MRKIIILLLTFSLSACAKFIEPKISLDENDSRETAIPVILPAVEKNLIGTANDEDFFGFSLIHADTIILNLAVPETKDYSLFLLDDNDTLALSRNGLGKTEIIKQFLPAGNYYALVIGENQTFSESQNYRLTIYLLDSLSANPHLLLGNPSDAKNSPDNYLLEKQQFTLSYNNRRHIANWVSWHLNEGWVGTVARQTGFHTENLPAGWYEVKDADYTGSGFDRGHICPSGDRTATATDNYATFVLSNIIPQAPDNNQGPWAEFEGYCRELAAQNYEVFIIAGSYDSIRTIGTGKVVVPGRLWKIVVLENIISVSGVNANTRIIAIDMPNENGLRNESWKKYRTSVDQIESATGFDFLSRVSIELQTILESKIDKD